MPTPRTRVTCTFTFEAAHRLAWHPGKCRNLHGHSYRLDVSVEGPLDANGVVLDFDTLQDVVRTAGDRRVGPPGSERGARQPDGRAAGPAGLGAAVRRRTRPGRAAPVGDGRLVGRPGCPPPGPDRGRPPGGAVRRARLDRVHGPGGRRDRGAAPGPHLRLRPAPPRRARPGRRRGRPLPRPSTSSCTSTPRRGAAPPSPTRRSTCRRPGRPTGSRPPTSRPATASSWPWPSGWPRPATSTPCGSGSTPSTTRATRTAGPSSSRPSGGWPRTGQRRGVEGNPIDLRTPLIECTKEQIVRLGVDHDAPLQLTWSCYRGGDRPVRDVRRLRPAGPGVRGGRTGRPGTSMSDAAAPPPTGARAMPSGCRPGGHPGVRGLHRHPGRGGPRRRAPGLRAAHRVQHPLHLLRPARGARAHGRPVPDRADRRTTRLVGRVEPARHRPGGRRRRHACGTRSPTTRSA